MSITLVRFVSCLPKFIKKNKVQFRISKEKEIEEVLWTYCKMSFLKKWSSELILPKFSKQLESKLKKLTSKSLGNSVNYGYINLLNDGDRALFLREFNSIYSLSKYKSVLNILREKWQKTERGFFQKITKIPDVKTVESYVCYITFYGSGGSFGRGNQIYVRANPDVKSDITFSDYTIAHELIHLMIEKLFKRKKLTQSSKEKLVDSIICKVGIGN
ncbi:MAG: hypothetical protein CEN90_652 [Parcubacteria group bacterium Licking1014_17]|nr:MAG: hypothetical protein CEN90_652 [Parcubacteria group bacterium Licking1014_17]